MGGLLSPPSPPSPPPLPIIADDGEAAKRRLRLEAINRRRRGRVGAIATSDKGLLAASNQAPKRKSLLGE